MSYFSFYSLIIFNIITFFLIINSINCISKDDLKIIDEKINADTIENEVDKVIKEYTEFNERYDKLVEHQNQEKDKEDYDRTKYKEKYKILFKECEIFYEYFYKQRKRLSDFINKPTGKVPEQVINAHNSILEYVLESKNLIKELGEKAFIDNPDL